MKFESTMTSKGTVTIPAQMRKALGLKRGNKVIMKLDKENNRVLMETGMTIEQVEAKRDEILGRYPDRPKGLSLKQMRDMANKKWLADRMAKQK